MADAASQRIAFLNAERFVTEPHGRLAAASSFFAPDRTLFSAVGADGKRRAVLDCSGDLSGQSAWIAALYQCADASAEDLVRLIEGAAERIGGEGKFSVAVTLDADDPLRAVFTACDFRPCYDQAVFSGGRDVFAPFASEHGASKAPRWRTVLANDRGAYFSFYRSVTRCPLGLTTAGRNARRIYALKDRRNNAKWVGAAAVSENSMGLYLEPVFAGEDADEIRLCLGALMERLGAASGKRLMLCVTDRQPALRAALPSVMAHTVAQSVFVKQLTVPIRRPETRRVDALTELSAAAAKQFESAPLEFSERTE